MLSRLHAAASDLTVQPALLLARWCSSHCRHFMLLAAALPVPSHTLLSLCYGLTCRDGLLEHCSRVSLFACSGPGWTLDAWIAGAGAGFASGLTFVCAPCLHCMRCADCVFLLALTAFLLALLGLMCASCLSCCCCSPTPGSQQVLVKACCAVPPFLAVPGLCMLRWRFTLRGVWGQLLAVCRRL